MGQQPSKPQDRLDAKHAEKERVLELLVTLRRLASAEATAGVPAGPGSDQARYDAAFAYVYSPDSALHSEQEAIYAHLGRHCASAARAALINGLLPTSRSSMTAQLAAARWGRCKRIWLLLAVWWPLVG